MVHYQIITQFPHIYAGYLEKGLPKRGIERRIFSMQTVQLRDYADKRQGRIDDAPYGGGAGMIVQIEPIDRALKAIKKKGYSVILMSPKGERLTQKIVEEFRDELLEQKESNGLTLICGYYQGVDARVEDFLVDRAISIGDFILSSGDLATICLIEAINRLLPNYLNGPQCLAEESFSEQDSLEYPQYTRPANYNGWEVPQVLRSGNQRVIMDWQKIHRKKNNKQ